MAFIPMLGSNGERVSTLHVDLDYDAAVSALDAIRANLEGQVKMLYRLDRRELGKFDNPSSALQALRKGESLECQDGHSYYALSIKAKSPELQPRVDGLVACVRLVESAIGRLREQRFVADELFREPGSCGQERGSPTKLRVLKTSSAETANASHPTNAEDTAGEARSANVSDALFTERDAVAHYRTRLEESADPVKYCVASHSINSLLSVLNIINELSSK